MEPRIYLFFLKKKNTRLFQLWKLPLGTYGTNFLSFFFFFLNIKLLEHLCTSLFCEYVLLFLMGVYLAMQLLGHIVTVFNLSRNVTNRFFDNKSLTCQSELSEYSLSHQRYYQGLFHCSSCGNSILSSNGEYLIVRFVGLIMIILLFVMK